MRNEGLVRVIGAGALGLGVVNMVVGAGIFILPGRIAAELGSAAILAYLVCSVAVVLVFLCFAEVGSRITRSGGTYAYIERDGLPKAGEFRLPFGPLIPLLSCLVVGWLLLQVPAEEAISITGLISASAVAYAIRAMVRGARSK